MDTLKSLHENISALADGELPDSELELTLAALNDPEARRAWQTYHLIGDLLRCAEARPGLDFAARVAARLAAEGGADEAAPQLAPTQGQAPLSNAQSLPPPPSAQQPTLAQSAEASARQAGAGGAGLVAPLLP
jgi:sigma-E factor negative regulatory protein RseA